MKRKGTIMGWVLAHPMELAIMVVVLMLIIALLFNSDISFKHMLESLKPFLQQNLGIGSPAA